jgi:mRNA-degrading endonuclease YafQ of YafQ-DinJ toxin-antitoxin module
MSYRKLIWTKRFSNDVKRAKRRNRNLESLQKVAKMLQSALNEMLQG